MKWQCKELGNINNYKSQEMDESIIIPIKIEEGAALQRLKQFGSQVRTAIGSIGGGPAGPHYAPGHGAASTRRYRWLQQDKGYTAPIPYLQEY